MAEEPFVRLTSKALAADINGEIAKSIPGYQSGQLLLMTAYLFGAAGMNEVASRIIQYGKQLGLPAMKAQHSVLIRKVSDEDGWEFVADGIIVGRYQTEQDAENAYKSWEDFNS